MGNSISNPSVKELSNLSNDIGQLFSSGDNYDMIIQAGEGQNMKEFFVHSLILAARSTYFKVELSLERKYKSNGIIIFKKPNISPEILKLILKFLYNGNVVLDNLSGTEVLKLFVVAFEWNLQNLINFIQPYLINNQVEYLRNEPVEILQMIFQFNVFENLRNNYLETICENPKILFESPNFVSLEKDILINLLKRDELEMEEIEIWNYILKWGISKMSTPLNIDDLFRWTSEDLERILHDLIPHIRCFQIPSLIFWKNVEPFEPIFPKKLYKDIIGYLSNPNTLPDTLILPKRHKYSLDSVLINKNHLFMITSWIDKKDKNFYSSKNVPYTFKLLYRASRDGFEEKKFHKLCDNKGSTIMISKLEKGGKLIGGYNPFSWNSNIFLNRWGSTSDSFLFSFANKKDLDSGSIARATSDNKYQKYAVFSSSDSGPAFGGRCGCGGCDLIIHGNSINRYVGAYPEVDSILHTKNTKTIVDYEIFQVIQV